MFKINNSQIQLNNLSDFTGKTGFSATLAGCTDLSNNVTSMTGNYQIVGRMVTISTDPNSSLKLDGSGNTIEFTLPVIPYPENTFVFYSRIRDNTTPAGIQSMTTLDNI